MATQMRTSIHGRRLGLDDSNRLIGTGRPTSVTITPAAGTTNQALITFQVVDHLDVAVAGVFHLDITLSDAATGAGLTATTAAGTVAAGASGVDLVTLVSKKALRVQTTAAGLYILAVTDAAKTAFYPCAVLGERLIPGAALVTGNYG